MIYGKSRDRDAVAVLVVAPSRFAFSSLPRLRRGLRRVARFWGRLGRLRATPYPPGVVLPGVSASAKALGKDGSALRAPPTFICERLGFPPMLRLRRLAYRPTPEARQNAKKHASKAKAPPHTHTFTQYRHLFRGDKHPTLTDLVHPG